MQEQKNWNQFKANLSDLIDARGNSEQAARIATMRQHENGIYMGEIKDEDGQVESATTCDTAAQLHKWAWEHKAEDVIIIN